MHVMLSPPLPDAIDYPECDGKPMADNTKQFDWILMLAGNLKALFDDRPDVFVSGNQNWYPVEGDPSVVAAPDVYVVFGRPKGDRPSYKQWQEDNVPMTVVFEVLSPKNDRWEMADKLAFYDEYGVEEYYIYDPDNNTLAVYLRRGEALRRVRPVDGIVSPRLGILFRLTAPEMSVYYPDGRLFQSFEEIANANRQAEKARADAEKARADAEKARADAERDRDEVRRRFARLTDLSRKARLGQASPEELVELDHLEAPLHSPPDRR